MSSSSAEQLKRGRPRKPSVGSRLAPRGRSLLPDKVHNPRHRVKFPDCEIKKKITPLKSYNLLGSWAGRFFFFFGSEALRISGGLIIFFHFSGIFSRSPRAWWDGAVLMKQPHTDTQIHIYLPDDSLHLRQRRTNEPRMTKLLKTLNTPPPSSLPLVPKSLFFSVIAFTRFLPMKIVFLEIIGVMRKGDGWGVLS